MYRPPHGVHVPLVQRRNARPRGAMPQGARPQVVRPCGGCARRGSGRDQYDFIPRGSGFQSYSSSGPRIPPCGARFPQKGRVMFGIFPNTFLGQMSQHWYPL
jgi:hypothetical protein